MATATVISQVMSISNLLTVPEDRKGIGAFTRMPPLAPVEEGGVYMTIRKRRLDSWFVEWDCHFPNDLEIILPEGPGEWLPELETPEQEQEQQQQEERNNAEKKAAEWMEWLKMMVPDPNLQWYVTENRDEVYRFYVNYQITNSLWNEFNYHPILRRQQQSEPSLLISLPLEIQVKIFTNLSTPDQICLGLTCKALANTSQHLNDGEGVLYDSSERLQILYRLESWMTDELRLCMACGMYFPDSPGFWEERKRSGRCRTRSMVYGRVYEDFEFQDQSCPECVAATVWGNVAISHMGMQMAVR
ncbi:hypothetical protein AJ79_01903 [Helicocarpus griseus UAMH5409]|uniref:F-box domain-containing protein n=1 Tax=Helicocarpus griseus UAMH5409 TaxID=1447875 RepID=A0A2B7Y3R8_9EURO|nr:hypothetical protein AJ79_01903 [Helicocarpus griseus UAMH5409]